MRGRVILILVVLAVVGAVVVLRLPSPAPSVPFEEAVAPGWGKNPALVRAQRRAYDGAPPVIPHKPFGMACQNCHNARGMDVPNVGFAPPSPHDNTSRAGAMQRCTQCHVFKETESVFVVSAFEGLAQNLRKGPQLHPFAPPRIPHLILMRENCMACHTGKAAREEIRCTHPDRARCTQCHVPINQSNEFER